jgi:ATP-dependent Clp protease ATP-binding subunit ClpA
MGARPLGRKIDELIKVPLSKKILFENLQNCNLNADISDDGVVFEIETQVHKDENTEQQAVE